MQCTLDSNYKDIVQGLGLTKREIVDLGHGHTFIYLLSYILNVQLVSQFYIEYLRSAYGPIHVTLFVKMFVVQSTFMYIYKTYAPLRGLNK